MKIDQQQQIRLLQDNLSSLRRIAGWTAEQLGERIGLTRQTISNLENRRTPMTLIQYIAIRALLDYEIEQNKDNPNRELLQKAVHILLDDAERFNAEEYGEIQKAISDVSVSATAGVRGIALIKVANALLGTSAAVVGSDSLNGGSSTVAGFCVGTLGWMNKILGKDKESF